jgi:pimeloyl-ACP methyl ester carboxylesterase
MFEGFEECRISTRGAQIFALTGGVGPPLLLLHGYPQSHVMWHAVAPLLRARFSLVIPDLRGYGDSAGPGPDPQHLNYSKRAMAADMVELMSALGHDRFALAGHDRGGRVAYRLVFDHPARVLRLAVLDIVPTLDMWERMNAKSALGSYHWLLLAQPPPLPERLIGFDPSSFCVTCSNDGPADQSRSSLKPSPNTFATSANRPSSKPRARTTVQVPLSTSITTAPTETAATGYNARRWCFGADDISLPKPNRPLRSGVHGRTM